MFTYKIDESCKNKKKASKFLIKVKEYISYLPKNIQTFISNFDIVFSIGDIYSLQKVPASGSIEIIENPLSFSIMISEKTSSIKETFLHELGHLLDMTIGCVENNKEFTKKNFLEFSLSQTNKLLQEKMEKEHFLFSNRPIEYCTTSHKSYTYREIFADSFCELLTRKNYLECLETKGLIYKILEKNLE